MPIRGVLFDLDDTLLDRPRTLARFTEDLVESYGSCLEEVDLEEAVRVMRNADQSGYREKADVFGQVLEELPWSERPEVEDLIAFWSTTFPKCTVTMAGAVALLETLRERGLEIGLVTNGPEDFQNAKIDRADLRSYLDAVIISGAVGMQKPDRRIFDLALSEMGLSAGEVWVVGDHPVNDVSGAVEAGMSAVWVRGDQAWPEALDPPQHTIDELEELIPALDGLPMVRG